MFPPDLHGINRIAYGLADHIPWERIFMEREETVHHGDINVLPFSGFFPVVYCCQNSCTCMHCRCCITDRYRGNNFRITLCCPSACTLGNHIVSRLVAVRTPVPETGDGAVNDIFLELFAGFIIQFQPIHNPWSKILHHHITFLDKFFY